MQMKRKVRSIILTLNLVLILALISCTSYPKRENNAIIMPEFPSFPSPIQNGEAVVTFNTTASTVSMPDWYWLRITNFVIDTEAAIERLKIDMEVHK